MGTYELETRIKRLESKWNRICCYIRSCIGISSTTGDPDLVLNQQGDWVAGGGGSYYLYSENYDAGSFTPQAATGLNSIAMGGLGAVASGDYSMSIGAGISSGSGSFAGGESSESNGVLSFSFGESNIANGEKSISFGKSNMSNGENSSSFGSGVKAESYSEIAIGISNTDYTPISQTTYELGDRLFVIGNGDDLIPAQSDAFTILKNGKTGIDIDNFETTTSNAKLQVNGLIATTISVIRNNTLLDNTNTTSIILVDNSANSVEIVLPDPATMFFNGMSAKITIKSTSDYNVLALLTILPSGAELIDNASSLIFTLSRQSVDLVTDGVDWYIVN